MEKFPARFVERLEQILPADEVAAYLEKCTEPLPKVVRLHSPPAGGSRRGAELNIPDTWHLSPTAVPEGFFIDRDDQKELPLGKTLQHFTGQIYSQSLSSMLPVVVLDPQIDEKIIDLCAAPGSKTSFLSQRMGNTGVVVANEPSGSRSKKLTANLDRTRCANTVVVQSDGTILNNFFAQEFDRILLDAPCSSEGYGRRDNSFFAKMWSEKKIFEAAKLQKRLITSAWEMLGPGGVMVYSTCTSAPEENEAVVQHLLDTYPGTIEVLPTKLEVPGAAGLTEWDGQKFDKSITQHARRFYPHLRSDAWNSESFFVVKLHKIQSLKRLPPKKPVRLPEAKFLKKNQVAEVITRLAKTFGLQKSWPQFLMAGKPTFYTKEDGSLWITSPEATRFMQSNLYRRVGLQVYDKDDNLSTEIAMALAPHASKNVVELDQDQTQRWLQGYEIPLAPFEKGGEKVSLFKGDLEGLKNGKTILVRHQHHGLGWGKVVNGKLKNKLERELVF